ncbi:molybdenum cofactor guanylyltransferase MobA [Acuticoccus sediminis]|uniref:molybdenum cofactor guanylyltransferase MobA n=1 Tax=Acuticoccus sediminis TaxID=2184697 RepID=UPI001FD00F6E|nr:molybdenum cofactor guanylyltransferase MobA [Acuticoccus sediminis]
MILAGGLSRRMGGGNKWLLPLGGRPVLSHVVERLAPQVSAMALNANDIPDGVATDLPVIADTVPDRPGPLAGILAAMEWAAGQGASHVVTVAADTPFFPEDLVVRLAAEADATGAPIVLAATREDGRRHPTFGLWSVALAADLGEALAAGTRKIVLWTDAHGAVSAMFDGDPFFNLNTPEDLARAEAMVA